MFIITERSIKIKETLKADKQHQRQQVKQLSLVLVEKNDKNENEGYASKRSERRQHSVISNQATHRSNLLLSLETKKVINERRLLTEDYTLAQQDNNDSKFDIRTVQHNSTGLLRAVKISKIRENSQKHIQESIYKYKKLDHPSILQLYEYFQQQDTSYQMFELYKAQTVSELMKSEHIFTEDEIIKLVLQLLSAIAYTNSMGMQHLDLAFNHILYINPDLNKLMCFKDLNFNAQGQIDLSRCLPGNQENSDVWTIGVLLYELLIGKNPFLSVEIPLAHRITKGLDTENLKDMETINGYAKDLITRMINYDTRPSAAELLRHPYILKSKKSNTSDMPQILKQMTNCKTDSQLMDNDNDGRISKQDIKWFLRNHEAIDHQFELFDVDSNGFLDYQEFLVAACNREELFQHELVLQFYRFLLYPTPSKKLSVTHLTRQFGKTV